MTIRGLVHGVVALFRKRRVGDELDEELDGFVEASVAQKRRAGMGADEARLAARREVGSRVAVKHGVWASRWEAGVENTLQDLRLGVRGLWKTPGFTVVAVLSLALGIGANTAIFTLLNAILLQPLPVADPGRLVLFGDGAAVGSVGGLPNRSWQLFSYPFYKEFRAKSKLLPTNAFEDIAADHSVHANTHIAINNAVPEPVHIDLVSGNYFDVMRVQPALGRTIAERDDQVAGAGAVVVANYAWFQRHFNGDASAVGRAFEIQGRPYTLIGVVQPGFIGASVDNPADLFVPLSMQKDLFPGWNGLDDKYFQSLFLIARLKPGATAAGAMPGTNLLFKQILRSDYVGATPSEKEIEDIQHASIELTSAANGLSAMRYFYSLPLKILMVIVALVLLIACANIANMLLARGVARWREVAVRMALGASRGRIVLQLFTESALLSVVGAGLGIALAWRAAPLLLRMSIRGPLQVVPENVAAALTPDLVVLGFTLLVTVLTALLFGVAPAFRATQMEARGGLTPALKEGRGGGTASSRGVMARGLIVGQIALSVLLLAAAGLFLRSLTNLTSIDTGFDAKNVMVFSLDESSTSVPSEVTQAAALIQLHRQVETRVGALPGVVADSFSSFTFDQGMDGNKATMQGVVPTPANSRSVLCNRVGKGFFQTLGLPLRSGRGFSDGDTLTSPKVAVVNESMQRVFFPNESAIGHHFRLGDDPAYAGDFEAHAEEFEIVGVVKDAKYVGLGEQQRMAAYFPYTQQTQKFFNFSVRYRGDKAPVIDAVRRTLGEINPNILVEHVYSLEDQVAGSIATQRLIAKLSAFFGVLAVLLACLGIYGLMSYSVVRRTNEIGIRLALGARTSALLWMVLRESLVLLGLGLAVGLPVAFAATRVLTQLLYQLSPGDPGTFLGCALVVAGMTVVAAWLPARRAARVDPMVALRCD
jgi:predicted permease